MRERTKAQGIKDLVLRAISDDYESLDIITRQISQFEESRDLRIADEEVRTALGELIQDNLAQAFRLSPWPPHAVAVPFAYESANELWFYATPPGKALAQQS